MGNNLRQLRTGRDWTLDEAAEHMSVSRGQYIKLERGERRLTNHYISIAARAFGVTEADVISQPRTVPLVGYVGAGAEAHFYASDQGEFDQVPAPEGATDSTVAAEIRGDSLGPFFDQWLVFYDDVRTPPTDDLIGKLCVVGLEDGRVLIKKLRRGSLDGAFTLQSQFEPPIYDVFLEWAAPVNTVAAK
jgi:transcriptional regulator with XRE-family HTH domain